MVVSCGGLAIVCSNGVAILLWWVFGGFFMVVYVHMFVSGLGVVYLDGIIVGLF
jgi:hypothetical protein